MDHGSPFDTPFDQLPNPKQVWVGSPGSYEEGIGKLAILTPEVVAKAATEIKTGHRVTLGWELTKLDYPNLNRQPCHHQIVPLLGGVAFDDIFTMNPRMSNPFPPKQKKKEEEKKEKGEDSRILMDGRDLQNKAVSGTGCGISLKQSPARINVFSTEAQPLKRLTTERIIALAYSIGPGKVLQVCHVRVLRMLFP